VSWGDVELGMEWGLSLKSHFVRRYWELLMNDHAVLWNERIG
jgi:hypothetical protein